MGLNLADCVAIPARLFPDREALVLGTYRLTFAQLQEQVHAAAGFLRAAGLGRGDRVVLLLPNTPHFPQLYFGILHAGGVVVPLNPQHTAAELRHIFADCQPAHILVWEEASDAAVSARDAVAPGARLTVVSPSVIADVLFDAEPSPVPEDTQPDDLAVIPYTGAYSGRLMGAQLTHFNLFQNSQVVGTRLLNYSEKDRCLAVLPLFHSFGQCVMMSTALLAGACVVLMPRFDAVKVLELIPEEKITVVGFVPTMFHFLLNAKIDPIPDLSSIRLVLAGGSTMPFEYFSAFRERFGHTILEGYGLTETSPVVSYNMSEATNRPGSVGLPLWGSEVRVVDEAGAFLPAGAIGEIVVRGHNVMKGYLNQPEANAHTLRDGWLYTGDWGCLDADGYVYLKGLKKDMLIRAGLNVYPREIECVLEAHPAVREAAVIGVPDPVRGEEPKAFIVAEGAADGLEKELVAWCREQLASYKCPRSFVFRASLPRDSQGCLDKAALRDS
jgi:long-chain acyl-CoA synthetase